MFNDFNVFIYDESFSLGLIKVRTSIKTGNSHLFESWGQIKSKLIHITSVMFNYILRLFGRRINRLL